MNGMASPSLLPGTATAALSYSIAVTPPANSPYASQCVVPPIAVTLRGDHTTSAPTLTPTPVTLTNRAIVTGTVYDSHGYPVANVSVTATPRPTAPGACNAPPTSPSQHYDRRRRDVLSPPRSQEPTSSTTIRLPARRRRASPTRSTLVVGASDTGHIVRHDVPLPAGALVQGVARTSLAGCNRSPRRRSASSSLAAPGRAAPPLPGCGADGDRRKRPVPDRGSSSPVSDPGRADFAPI